MKSIILFILNRLKSIEFNSFIHFQQTVKSIEIISFIHFQQTVTFFEFNSLFIFSNTSYVILLKLYFVQNVITY